MAAPARAKAAGATDPPWYKDAIVYELHVRAFCDGNGDGIGDFPGLTSKLDYLYDLGITAIWLLPFYVSPLKDDGYDIADYRRIHPAYGTMRDFRKFLSEAHARGIRVITELVLNAIKYAFPKEKDGARIQVSYETAGSDWKLTVSDNGVGKIANDVPATGLGTAIVEALVKQLEAKVEVIGDNDGTSVSVTRATFTSRVPRAA